MGAHVSTTRTRLTRLMSRTSFFYKFIIIILLAAHNRLALFSPRPSAVYNCNDIRAAQCTRTQTLPYNCPHCVTFRIMFYAKLSCLFRSRGFTGFHPSRSFSRVRRTCWSPTTTKRTLFYSNSHVGFCRKLRVAANLFTKDARACTRGDAFYAVGPYGLCLWTRQSAYGENVWRQKKVKLGSLFSHSHPGNCPQCRTAPNAETARPFASVRISINHFLSTAIRSVGIL